VIDLKQLSVDLSFKINDPVSDTKNADGTIQKYAWEDDGKIYSSADRLRLINQGASKLYMYLLNLKREYRPKFVDVTAVEELNLNVNNGEVLLDRQVRKKDGTLVNLYFKEIKEIFVTYQTSELPNGEIVVKANPIKTDEYASVYHGNNTIGKPSFKEKRVYWTLLGNVIHLLPKSSNTLTEYYKEMMLVYSPDITNLTYDSSNYITQDYYLMLLILSALEAMVDMNNQAKFQLLTAELTSLFQLLGQVTQLEESKDGK